jgi:UDP-MurNAc hydroxylase
VLTDPWFNDGAFGSWLLAHDVHRIPVYKRDYDLIYISHVHEDHFDERFLSFISKDVPIVFPEEPVIRILLPKLSQLGFKNLFPLGNEGQVKFKDLTMTLFYPFQKKRFDKKAVLPNFIDSALLFDDGIFSFLNTNDNFPTAKSLKKINKQYGKPDLVSLLYNTAGFYPQCIDNLTPKQKIKEKQIILNKCLDVLYEAALASASKVMPFAGDYFLGGELAKLNKFLAVSTPLEANNFLLSKGIDSIVLGGGGIYSFKQHTLVREGFHYTIKDGIRHAKNKKINFFWNLEPYPSFKNLNDLIKLSFIKLMEKQKKLNIFPDYDVTFLTKRAKIIGNINLSDKLKPNNNIQIKIEPRLLKATLERRFHWDSVLTGCHVSIYRSNHPDYDVDVYSLLSLFHI